MSRCPVAYCRASINEPMLMCSDHWYEVPVELRKKVWRLFKSSPGCEEHRRACFDAIAFVNARQKPEQGALL